MLDPLGPGQVGNVHQPVDAFFDLNEGAELGHVPDAALDHRTDAVALFNRGPGIRLQLLQTQERCAGPWY